MDIFDIIGPIMVGPSSSHTAGAARIGYVTSMLLDEEPAEARILLHGSFAHTGTGHGTDKALVAGILGMKPDDERLKNSLKIAETKNLKVSFENEVIEDAHPNTAVLYLTGRSGKKKTVEAASVGGGNIEIKKIDGQALSISGRYPTLVVTYSDLPGMISNITRAVGQMGYNIFQVRIGRDKRGGTANMSLELDGTDVVPSIKDILMQLKNVQKVVVLQPY